MAYRGRRNKNSGSCCGNRKSHVALIYFRFTAHSVLFFLASFHLFHFTSLVSFCGVSFRFVFFLLQSGFMLEKPGSGADASFSEMIADPYQVCLYCGILFFAHLHRTSFLFLSFFSPFFFRRFSMDSCCTYCSFLHRFRRMRKLWRHEK